MVFVEPTKVKSPFPPPKKKQETKKDAATQGMIGADAVGSKFLSFLQERERHAAPRNPFYLGEMEENFF